jgi:hypothetical protein
MADRFLKLLVGRLRFVAANPPLLPLLAFLLVAGAAAVQFFVLPGREAAIEVGERRYAALERSQRRAQIERRESGTDTGSARETRQRLLERFPDESELNAELGRLIALAGEQGLHVPSGDYRLLPAKGGLFDRYVLSLPVKGNYRAIRQYVGAARREFPDLAVEDISLRRDNIGNAEVEAQLRFVLFGRRPA